MDATPLSEVQRGVLAALDRLKRRGFYGKITIELQAGEVRNVHIDENHKPDQLTNIR